MPSATYAGVEMGGTKCVCILGSGPNDIRAQEVLPTGDPATTLGAIAQVLERWNASLDEFEAIGVASFGPLDLRRESPTYGRIGTTPKELLDRRGSGRVLLRGASRCRSASPPM